MDTSQQQQTATTSSTQPTSQSSTSPTSHIPINMRHRLTDGSSNFIRPPEGVERMITAGEVQRAFTLFCPISMVETLTKTQHLLVGDVKRGC